MNWRFGASLVIALACAAEVPAQVVRGRVTDASSSTPVVGALVSLLGTTVDSGIVSVLTDRNGDYAVRAPGAGTYRLAVKRIGVQRFVSTPFLLGSGETRNLDVPIASVAMTLPVVSVSGLCVTRPIELRRISSLWDEALTALEATEISLRDKLMAASISRYAAELDPATLRVLFDWRSDAQVMTSQPFTSLSGDSLSAVGYWRRLPGDSVEYLAPDASALSSNAFIRDHCFTLSGARRDRRGLVGLSFVPATERTLPDIAGTIWIDARSFELRLIEFRYTRLPAMAYAQRVGGEVHFARLASGAWIVDHWFIRMPQVVQLSEGLEARMQLFEEGGAVITDSVRLWRRPGSVVGSVRDSTGRPIEGAVVRAVGTHRQALTNDKGAFRLDSLPPGPIAVTVHTDGYDSFGVLAGRSRLDVQQGAVHQIMINAPKSGDIRREACTDPNLRYIQRALTRGALRLLMVDSATSVPMPGIRFLVSWPAQSDVGGGRDGEERHRQAVTDSRGVATFCDLPYSFPVEVSLVGPDDSRLFVMMVQLSRVGITGKVVTGRMNR